MTKVPTYKIQKNLKLLTITEIVWPFLYNFNIRKKLKI